MSNQLYERFANIGSDSTDPFSNRSNNYAGFRIRLCAVLIDMVILALIFTILGKLTGISFEFLSKNPSLKTHVTDTGNEMNANLLIIVITVIYFPLAESSKKLQGSLGKYLLKIKITGNDGHKISFSRALIRHLARGLISSIFLIGYIMVAFTKEKRGLHDFIAGTYVVRR